ncbi:MAG: hypothetical protein ABMA26_13210 [Limisphaerales bacterium]
MTFHEFIPHIEAARQAGLSTLALAGLKAEPAQATYAIEEYRWFWKPQTPNILLVADSSVYTSATDLAAPEWEQYRQDIVPPAFPRNPYCGHLYCPGFGSIQVSDHLEAFRQEVVKEVWDMLVRLAGHPCVAGGLLNQQLIQWKHDMLDSLKSNGIWLLDASVLATHRGIGAGDPEGHRHLPDGLACKLHGQWWSNYGSALVSRLASENAGQRPSIWLVGQTLHNRLSQ